MRKTRWMGVALLCSGLALRPVGFAQPVKPEPARSRAAPRPDAGQPQPLSEEDLEVLKNLELLQAMGESDDLELLLALSDPQ